MTTGGTGNPNFKCSPEITEKRRMAANKRWQNPEQREKARERGQKLFKENKEIKERFLSLSKLAREKELA